MARTRSENYGDIQSGILAQAAALYSAQGYMRASIADLAAACGLSRGALYHYFESKEAILFALLERHLRHMLERVGSALAGETEPRAQFAAAVRTVAEVNAASPAEQRVLLNDLSFLRPEEQEQLNDLGRQIVALMADLLVRLDGRGRMTRRSRQIYTMMLFGMINYTYTWYDPSGPVGPDEFADMAIDVFLNGFAPADMESAPARSRRGSGLPRTVVSPLTR